MIASVNLRTALRTGLPCSSIQHYEDLFISLTELDAIEDDLENRHWPMAALKANRIKWFGQRCDCNQRHLGQNDFLETAQDCSVSAQIVGGRDNRILAALLHGAGDSSVFGNEDSILLAHCPKLLV
jgi:hypothetical protein